MPHLSRAVTTPFGSRAMIATLVAALATLAASCGGTASPGPTGGPSTSAPSQPASSASADASTPPSAAASPTAIPSSAGERLTVLLIGFDNTTERQHSELTDSLIVASLDPVASTVSLLGLPRDLSDFPLPGGTVYRQKLNSLYVAIQGNPSRYGGTAGAEPEAVLAGVIGNVVGVPIDYWAAIDMDGFAAMIDAVGGVDIYVEDAICDAGYRQLGLRGFEAAAGWWHMTGPQALGLARVRHDAGGSDFQRMRRQQDLLVAIRDAIVGAGADGDPLAWIGRVPTIRTNLPPELIVAAGATAATISAGRIHGRLIQPFGNGGTELYDNRGYVLSANIDEIREIAGLLFTDPGTRPTTGRPQALPDKPSTLKDLPRFNGC